MKKPKITPGSIRETLQYCFTFLVTFFILQLLVGMAYIPSASMEPTLNVGRKYPFCQVSYLFNGPDRGDIIVFDDEGVIYCKRIIGIPGDSVDIIDGCVFINGEKIDEPYANGLTYSYTEDGTAHYDVPEDEYFFLGDNRCNSRDARLWGYPFIKRSQIIGHILFK